jgi:uncharacterized SAM-binding protein YcdF (DUF218 family)
MNIRESWMSPIHRIIGLKKSTETIQNIYFQKTENSREICY